MAPRVSRRHAAVALALAAALALIAAPPAAVPAGAQGNARAWGLAGAYTAAARGLDAVAWNPANLALSPAGTFAVELASVAADLHNNAFTLSRYNEISGATLDDDDKRRLLADIPAGGFRLQADARASAIGLLYGPAALTFQGLAGAGGTVAKDFFDLALLGNPVDRAFRFDGTGGEGYAVAAATLSAGAPLATGARARLCAGVNLRYLRGLYELHFEEATGGLVTTLASLAGDARASWLTAAGGAGYAVDLGLTLQAPRGWTLALAADNVASRLDWNREPERRIWTVAADSLDARTEDLEAAVVETDTTLAAAPYRTTLPGRLRLGASNRVGPLLVALDVAQGLEDRAGVSTRTEVRAGAEWLLAGWARPRCGLGLGGAAGASGAVGLGLGLGPLKVDLAAMNRGRLWPTDTRGLALAAATRLEF